MTVSTIASIASGLSRVLNNQQAKPSAPSAVLSQLFSNSASKSDSAGLSTALALQNQIAQFRVASQNVAQASTVITTADAGASQISRELGKLKDLAARAASYPLSNLEREQINAEFQAIRSRINSIAQTTKFGNDYVLNGTSNQLKIQSEDGSQEGQMVADLTDKALFGDKSLDLLTANNAQATLEAVEHAQSYTDTQISTLKSLQDGLDYAVGTLQTAIQNQDAANSTLEESDLMNQLLGGGSESNGSLDTKALFAQVNRLPPSMLQLLSE